MSLQWKLQTFDQVRSTQSLAKEAAAQGARAGLVIHAMAQDEGHGRHGRPWISERGNLYLSLVLRPECKATKLGQFSLLTGLAVFRAIAQILGHSQELQLKWPNDVLLGEKKCAGLLLETELDQSGNVEWLVAGIGINILSAPENIGAALQDYTKSPIELDVLRDSVLEQVSALYNQWKSEGFSAIKQGWLAAAHPKGAPLTVKIGTQIERGHFHALDESGNLILSLGENQLKTITAGEVYLEAAD